MSTFQSQIAIEKPKIPLSLKKEIVSKQTDKQPTLRQLLNIVATEKERMTLVFQNKVFLAVVPIEDVEVIEQLEDCIDSADIEDAHKEGGKSIPLEQIETELGL
jgi:hypothetical protein